MSPWSGSVDLVPDGALGRSPVAGRADGGTSFGSGLSATAPPRLRVAPHPVTGPAESGAPEPRRPPISLAAPLARLACRGVWPMLLGLDLVAVALGVLVTALLHPAGSPDVRTVAFGAVFLTLLWAGGLYRARLSLSVLDDLPLLAGRWLGAASLAVLGQFAWAELVSVARVGDWRFLWGAAVIGAGVLLLRAPGYAIVRALRSRGLVAHRTLIVGAGRVGRQLADILDTHREYGLHPLGFLDADPTQSDRPSPVPVLGGPEALTQVLRGGQVHVVVVAFCPMKESEMVRLIRTCDRFRCELFVVPRLFELQQVGSDMDNAWGLPLVRLRRATYRSPAWRVKRLVDILVSVSALVFLAPVLTLVTLAVRLDGGKGILFRQERVGVDGHHFQVFKFRTLRPATAAESDTIWSIADDARLTRVGRFLRKTSLDELPQLLNILRGDMSLVGPRPERPHFVHKFGSLYPSYEARHRVPSGLTGWAQVHGLRGDTSIDDRARFDNYYIENWSLWLDVKIILRTFGSVLRGAGG